MNSFNAETQRTRGSAEEGKRIFSSKPVPTVASSALHENEISSLIIGADRVKLLTYLRLSDLHLGLIINFHEAVLKNGVFRVVNDLAPNEPAPKGSFQI